MWAFGQSVDKVTFLQIDDQGFEKTTVLISGSVSGEFTGGNNNEIVFHHYPKSIVIVSLAVFG